MRKPLEQAGEEYLRLKRQIEEKKQKERAAEGVIALRFLVRAITYLENPDKSPGGKQSKDKSEDLRNALERTWGKLESLGLEANDLNIDEVDLTKNNHPNIVFNGQELEDGERVIVDLPDLRRRVDAVKHHLGTIGRKK